VDLVVQSNEVHAGISFPLNVTADLSIAFEQVEGLSAESIGLSADLVSPTDPQLLSRLQNASIPGAFPVLIRIQPPAAGGLTFQGVVSIEVHTHLLPFTVNTPLRLFAASEGGRFHDITASVGMGSYRCTGRKGSFSEFLILVDLRRARRRPPSPGRRNSSPWWRPTAVRRFRTSGAPRATWSMSPAFCAPPATR